MGAPPGEEKFNPWRGDPNHDRLDREAFAAWLKEYGHDDWSVQPREQTGGQR